MPKSLYLYCQFCQFNFSLYLSLFFFFPLFWPPCSTGVPGRGSDLCHRCDLYHRCGNDGSLTYCAELGIEPLTSFTKHHVSKVYPHYIIPSFLFLFIVKWYLIVSIYHFFFFNHSSVDRRELFSLFGILWIMLLWTFLYKFLMEHRFSILWIYT